MAYGHFWRRPPELDTEAFAEVVEDVKLILERVAEMDIKLAGPTGTGHPEVSRYSIAFNGSLTCGHRFMDLGKPYPKDTAEGVQTKEPPYDRKADPWISGPYLLTRACGGNCSRDPFIVDRKYMARDWERQEHGGYFCGCETDFKPYDLVVTAVMIRMKERLGDDFKITSDGDEHAFADAHRLCRELFGFPSRFELESHGSEIV